MGRFVYFIHFYMSVKFTLTSLYQHPDVNVSRLHDYQKIIINILLQTIVITIVSQNTQVLKNKEE